MSDDYNPLFDFGLEGDDDDNGGSLRDDLESMLRGIENIVNWNDIYTDLIDRGYDSDWINEHVGMYGADDFDADQMRPSTASELEDMLNWLDDAGITDWAYIWYDEDDGLWHYAIDYEG